MSHTMHENLLINYFDNHKKVIEKTIINEEITDNILLSAQRITDAVKSGHTVMIFGNGGSAADAQHIAAEFTGRFLKERSPLNVIALTANTSVLTAVANDYSFKEVFSRQIEALAKLGDIAVGISTSGSSENVINALNKAKEKGAYTIALTGENYNENIADLIVSVPSDYTPNIQELHIIIGHFWADFAEKSII